MGKEAQTAPNTTKRRGCADRHQTFGKHQTHGERGTDCTKHHQTTGMRRWSPKIQTAPNAQAQNARSKNNSTSYPTYNTNTHSGHKARSRNDRKTHTTCAREEYKHVKSKIVCLCTFVPTRQNEVEKFRREIGPVLTAADSQQLQDSCWVTESENLERRKNQRTKREDM
jgi:hypothetical protein